MTHDAESQLSVHPDLDPGDGPVFDPKCPKCGRFWKGPVDYWMNWHTVTKAEATCSRCGVIEPVLSHWRSDEW